ncbi:MAG: STAS domain-containing protein [Planctomycetota bacterium]|nr:STAS domain-containing protein [Planctomycetota bacterium]
MGFSIRKTPDDCTVLDLSGDLDRHKGLKELRETLGKFNPAKTTKLVLNFRDVTYVCSEAVGMVCALAEEIRRAGGRVACCALNGLPRDVFEILGVPKILRSFATEADALTGMNQDSPSSSTRRAQA